MTVEWYGKKDPVPGRPFDFFTRDGVSWVFPGGPSTHTSGEGRGVSDTVPDVAGRQDNVVPRAKEGGRDWELGWFPTYSFGRVRTRLLTPTQTFPRAGSQVRDRVPSKRRVCDGTGYRSFGDSGLHWTSLASFSSTFLY